MAIAVAMPDGGLITPVLKSADQTDLYQLSRNWVRRMLVLKPTAREAAVIRDAGLDARKGLISCVAPVAALADGRYSARRLVNVVLKYSTHCTPTPLTPIKIPCSVR